VFSRHDRALGRWHGGSAWLRPARSSHKTLARSDLAPDRGPLSERLSLLAVASRFNARQSRVLPLRLAGYPLTLINKTVALVLLLLALVRDPVALIRRPLTLVCDPLTLVCDPLALVCDPLALIRRPLALIRSLAGHHLWLSVLWGRRPVVT